MKTTNTIFILFCCLILGVLAGVIFSASQKQPDPNTADLRQHLIDSIKVSDNKLKIAEIESIKQIEANKVVEAKRKVIWYKNESERLKIISDSLLKLNYQKLDTICKELLGAKQNEIDTLNCTVESLGQEAESYSRQLYLCENQRDLQAINDSINLVEKLRLNTEIYNLQRSNKRNWIERNGLWLGIGSGILGTLLIKK